MEKTQSLLSPIPTSLNESQRSDTDIEMAITKTISPSDSPIVRKPFKNLEMLNNVKIKREVAGNQVKKPRNTKFSTEEDNFLKEGIKRYGQKSWSLILKDNNFEFHQSRTRDSLRMRADSASFRKFYTKKV